MKRNKPPTDLQTVKFWVRYDPQRRMLRDTARFKWMLAAPSKGSGEVVIEVKGHYIPSVNQRGQQS